MTERKRLVIFLAAMLLVLGLGVIFGVNWGEADHVGGSNGLPVASIELLDASAEDFRNGSKDTKYRGKISLSGENGDFLGFSDIEFKGRGNTTWTQNKKPFQIKVPKSINLLGIGKAKKWVFLATQLDDATIRNDVALKVAKMLDVNFAYRGKFVQVYFGDEYEGLYYLTKKVEIGKGAVDLRNNDAVLVELDNLHRDDDDYCYHTYAGNCLVLKDAVSKENSDARMVAMRAFVTDFSKMEQAAKSGDYEAVARIADIDSLAKYFLLNEFILNFDANSTSFYFYRDGAEDKIHAGPVWDFDFSMGNLKWSNGESDKRLQPDMFMPLRDEALGINGGKRNSTISDLLYRMMEMPEFQAKVEEIYKERLHGRGQEIMFSIVMTANSVRGAAVRDSMKWEKGDYDTEIKKLLAWMQKRYWFFEQRYGFDGAGGRVVE